MPLLCAQCQRVESHGRVLLLLRRHGVGRSRRRSGAPWLGSVPDAFRVPGGQSSKNFDQLATACQEQWKEAVSLLKQGFFYSFLGGLGRVDLAMAAKEAAEIFRTPTVAWTNFSPNSPRSPSSLPNSWPSPPRSILANSPWAKIAIPKFTSPTSACACSKLRWNRTVRGWSWRRAWPIAEDLQFGHELKLPVHVKGQHLRAGNKPLTAKLLVDSNGGVVTILVRVEVPIKPFEGGLFAGCVTPREVAEHQGSTENRHPIVRRRLRRSLV